MPYFAGFKLAEVEPPDVRAFVQHLLDQGLRPAGVRSVLAPLKAMYATAVEDGAVPANPTRDVRIGVLRGHQGPEEEPVRAMTRAELGKLLGAVPERWRLLFELLAHTGLRISELSGLQWRDVEFGIGRGYVCAGRTAAARSASSSPSTRGVRFRCRPAWPGACGQYRGPAWHGPGVYEPAGRSAERWQPTPARADSCDRAGRVWQLRRGGQVASVGYLPHLPPYVRIGLVRGRSRT